MKGIIFDFNGTLFWDSALHKKAWREYSKKLRGTMFTDEEMVKYMFGRTNEQIISYAIGKKPDTQMVEKYATEKEALYRQMCLDNPKDFHLAKGAIEFLDFLKRNNIPRTIATMSNKTNVDFFIEHFNLEKWFNIEKIVYDNGKIPSKPAPDIYEIAAKNICLNPSECVVIEDALSGIEAARRAKIGKIIAICSEESPELYQNLPYVNGIISDFTEFDTKMFILSKV